MTIDTAIEISEAMFAAAEVGDWDRVQELDTLRAAVLDDLSFTAADRAKLVRLVRLNAAVAERATEARDGRQAELRALARGKRATENYAALA
ncbi:MAG: hypothetical protein V2J02_18540 [Pseudomonadales bacterium]|jgi:hypothetical protein|nr:hypothetical protein [Pseudomonadales bacterium]